MRSVLLFWFVVCLVFSYICITKQVSEQNSAVWKFDEVHEGLEVLFAFSFWFLCSLYLLCGVFVKIVWPRLKEGGREGEGVSKYNDERWRHKREVIF